MCCNDPLRPPRLSAAPAEMRTPNLHRATIAQQRVRMEGWRQRRPGSNAKPTGKKKKNRLDTNRPSHGRTWPITSLRENSHLGKGLVVSLAKIAKQRDVCFGFQ